MSLWRAWMEVPRSAAYTSILARFPRRRAGAAARARIRSRVTDRRIDRVTSPDVQDRLQRALGAAYTIDRELGGGGMSRVFVADEASLGRKVVVKVLRPELAEGISSERFKREVRLAARLQHPHVVPLLAAGELDAGVLFYTMPFVEGESLRARLDRDGGLPVGDVVRILRDAASALAYAHAQGIVHRDIKPENILLSHGGAVVADFGIAKAISASIEADGADGVHRSTLTAAGTSLGTPAYMSPEQASGDIVDHRSDLYALGVVAYELLAGRPPFQGRNAQQLLSAHAVLRVLEGIADASRATTQSSDPTVVPTRARASRVPAWLIASAIAAT